MTELLSYLAELDGIQNDAPAPVHLWTPERRGEIDIVIKKDGTWLHEGEPVKRARLVRLFSKILKFENGEYFLTTPYEQLRIVVEDAPFVAVFLRVEGAGESQKLYFTTNVGDGVCAGAENTISVRGGAKSGQGIPYINVRDGLTARIGRSIYYDLVALCESDDDESRGSIGVWSDGAWFPLGSI